MIITAEALDAIRVTFSDVFAKAYEAAESWKDKIATTVQSTTRSNVYGFRALQMRLRKWVGPRVAQNLSEHKYTLENVPYEGTIEVDKFDIEDDNLGMYVGTEIPDLAQAKKKHPDQILVEVLQANPDGFDEVAFFDGTHPNFNATGVGATTYSNDETNALDGDGFDAAYAQMVSIVGENGQPLGVKPNRLFVPPQLKRKALVLMQSTTYAQPGEAGANGAVVDNVLKGWCEVVVMEELANEPNVWYLADCSKAIKPLLYQLREDGPLVARDNPQDPKVFDQAIFTYGTHMRDAAGVTLPFLIQRNTIPVEE
jgi:phage major head subunit gpT-like protein